MDIYLVKPGDNIDAIARRYGVPAERIIFDNQLVYPYALAVGQTLLVRAEPSVPSLSPIRSNGYAYPFISRWVLGQTLPYLTVLSVFSYGFTMEGALLPPPVDDEPLTARAGEAGVLPFLVLTPFGPDGRFNNALIHSVVQTPAYRSRLLADLQQTMQAKGYRGLDIDFEYILPEDRDAFTEFVRLCADAMHREGWQLSVALAPKTSADQKGLLYEGKDYPALGAAADQVLLMTYEWGYKYGPPMAVAPLPQVRRVVEYAVTEIPPEKVNLGIPNYGYDWPLPFLPETTAARTIGNIEAVQLAIAYGVPIEFDEIAKAPFFFYRDVSGITHEVWFEDARSLQAKFDLLTEFGLSGIGCWQIMQLFRPLWLLLVDRFPILSA